MASSNILFKRLPSRLGQFELYISIILGILLLFILVTCCRVFDLHLLSQLVLLSTFQYLFIPFAVKQYQYRYSCESFISTNINHILSFCLSVQIPLPYRLMDIKSAVYWLSPDTNQKVCIFPRTMHANQMRFNIYKGDTLKVKFCIQLSRYLKWL